MTDSIPFLAAFGAGLASFLLPCVLPLVPVYLASLAGPEIFEAGTKRRLPLFFHSLSFVIGFTLVFSLWGAGLGLIGSALVAYSEIVQRVVGSLLIVFGLFMLVALKVPWLNYEKRLTPSLGTTSGYLRSFLTGGVFCLVWIPCVGPVLGGILSLALDSATVLRGASLLASYSLGLGLPFLITGVAFDLVNPLLKLIHRYSNWVYLVSGLVLIAIGILVVTNNLTWLYL